MVEKGRQHGKQLRYRELCNQSHNGKKGGRRAMPPCSIADRSRIPPRMVGGEETRNGQGRDDLHLQLLSAILALSTRFPQLDRAR